MYDIVTKIFTVFCVFLLSYVIGNAQTQLKEPLACDEFYNKIESLDNSIIFDLRSEDAYKSSRIPNAILADSKEKFSLFLSDINKNSPLFIYCQEGVRSKQCAEWLDSLKYKNVYQLAGGFKNWKKHHYPIDTTKIDDENEK